MIDLYSVLCYHFADAMAEVDRVAADEGLKESLMRYAIESGAITEKVYRNEMEAPIEDMKRFLDGILHIYDEGRTKVSMSELFGIVTAAEEKLAEKKNSVAPVPFPVSWTVKMKKKQKETQDILSYHTQAAGCSDKARAKASGGRQPIEECGRTGL